MNFTTHLGRYSGRATPSLRRTPNAYQTNQGNPAGIHLSQARSCSNKPASSEYATGAAIGWHRDRSVFGDVIGVSLVSACTFRFRRKTAAKWDRQSLDMRPRSAYLLHGQSRTEWEHSIPAVRSLRYSITFRSLSGR